MSLPVLLFAHRLFAHKLAIAPHRPFHGAKSLRVRATCQMVFKWKFRGISPLRYARKYLRGLDLTRPRVKGTAVSYFVAQSLKYYLRCAANPLNGNGIHSNEKKTPSRWGERPGVGGLPRGAGGNFCRSCTWFTACMQ